MDQERRRLLIAEALLDVTRRDGVRGVSVRSVAERAGLSVGSMRNTAASQSELVAFAMTVVGERVAARVATRLDRGLPDDGEAKVEALTDLCCEVLPLDEDRRAEAEVWLELVTAARTDSSLAGVSATAHDGLRRLARTVVAARGVTDSEAAERGARELHALLDGLALHLVLHPADRDVETVRAVVRDRVRPVAG